MELKGLGVEGFLHFVAQTKAFADFAFQIDGIPLTVVMTLLLGFLHGNAGLLN
ncbi:hypothetical protein D3C76_1879590 [compost metagenome]